jgi:hypothetical protein
MIDIQVVVSPQELAAKLRRMAGLITPEVDADVKDMAYAARDLMKTYDAAPKPTYQRTGDMSRQTVARRGEQQAYWIVEMRAPYSGYVRGLPDGRPPAYMHRGRWREAVDIVKEATADGAKRVIAAIRRAKQKAGLG